MSTELSTINQNQSLSIGLDPELMAKFREALQNFTMRLNKAPKKEKIQKQETWEYLPISTVEKDLDRLFFGQVEYQIIDYRQIVNEISCHARLIVLHPVTLQKMTFDGLGSAVIQQDKNTKVSDFILYKKPNALQTALPKAYAAAVKNAAKKIGKAFGSDINRKFEDDYEPMNIKTKATKEEIEADRISHLIKDCDTIAELKKLEQHVPAILLDMYNEKMNELEGEISRD